jgi:hypothetical protein
MIENVVDMRELTQYTECHFVCSPNKQRASSYTYQSIDCFLAGRHKIVYTKIIRVKCWDVIGIKLFEMRLLYQDMTTLLSIHSASRQSLI